MRPTLGPLAVVIWMAACGGDARHEPDAVVAPGTVVINDTSADEDSAAPAPDGVDAPGDASAPGDAPRVAEGDTPRAEDTTGGGSACMSFDDSVQPIFDQYCTNCHHVPDADNLLDLTSGASFASLMTTTSQADASLTFVVPGDASASDLVEKMNPNPSHGSVMPITGPAGGTPISAAEGQVIVDWIDTGATLEPWGCPQAP